MKAASGAIIGKRMPVFQEALSAAAKHPYCHNPVTIPRHPIVMATLFGIPIDPLILFFFVGVFARIAGATFEFPPAIYQGLAAFLMLCIGLKGGVALNEHANAELLGHVALASLLAALLAGAVFLVLRTLFRSDREQAATLAAHYGSVSVVTYAVASNFLTARNIPYESHMPMLLAVMEVVGILVALFCVRARNVAWRALSHDLLISQGIYLLLAGMVVGAIAGKAGLARIEIGYVQLFPLALALYLVELGLVVGKELSQLRRGLLPLVGFALVWPLLAFGLGAFAAHTAGLTQGGVFLVGVLCASASYIAAPSAVKAALPNASVSTAVVLALGVTFPFNVVFGLELYWRVVQAWF